jgi:hypothetical protein
MAWCLVKHRDKFTLYTHTHVCVCVSSAWVIGESFRLIEVHSSRTEVKGVEVHFHSPLPPSWCGAQLKHSENFTFSLYSNYIYCLNFTRWFVWVRNLVSESEGKICRLKVFENSSFKRMCGTKGKDLSEGWGKLQN